MTDQMCGRAEPRLVASSRRSLWGRALCRGNAHAGSRTRVTSMGGLYDAATLHALLAPQGGDYSISAFDFPSMHVIQWLRTGSPCVRNGFDSCARGSATAVRHGWRRLWSLDRSECCAESTEAWTLLASLHTLRTPGVEPGSQAWEACMIPLHYVRYKSH